MAFGFAVPSLVAACLAVFLAFSGWVLADCTGLGAVLVSVAVGSRGGLDRGRLSILVGFLGLGFGCLFRLWGNRGHC